MKKLINIVITASLLFSISSCKQKDGDTTPNGKTKLEFFNVVGSSNLNMNLQWYQNENGDSFKVTTFNYYISNITLHGAGNNDYSEAESYHLVQQMTPASTSFDMLNVPYGKYSSITFMIGVDSARNTAGAQTGALDTSNGMFWSWNTGYIMLKFEGNSPQAPTADGMLMMHAGGFSGNNSVLKTITLTFDNPIEVKENGVPHIHLQADVLALFKSPNKINFATTNTIHMPGADAKKFADNYANMFTVTYAGF